MSIENIHFVQKKDYVCQSEWVVPKLICAEVNEIFRNLCRSSAAPKFGYPLSRLTLDRNGLKYKQEDLYKYNEAHLKYSEGKLLLVMTEL